MRARRTTHARRPWTAGPAGRADRVRLDPESVQAVARAIVEMMRSDEALPVPADESALLTAAEVARRFDVPRDSVYAHAGELDVIKLGKGR